MARYVYRLWALCGRAAFWVAWPAMFVVMPLTRRTRLLLVADGKILVVKPWLGSGKWVLPGGGLHRGEAPLDGVLRELHEETGARVDRLAVESLGFDMTRDSGLHVRHYRFAATLPDLLPLQKRRLELLDAQWLSVEQLSTETAEASACELLAQWQQKQ